MPKPIRGPDPKNPPPNVPPGQPIRERPPAKRIPPGKPIRPDKS